MFKMLLAIRWNYGGGLLLGFQHYELSQPYIYFY